MISLYIDDKLNEEHKAFVEEHFLKCPSCFEKYKQMKNIIENLKLSYEKILKEVENVETVNLFNIREYEKFHNNISAYIDNELTYEESVEFRKYLLKSKSARNDLRNIYKLKNAMQDSIVETINDFNVDFSKKIVFELKKDQDRTFQEVYLKIAGFVGLVILSWSGLFLFTHTQKIPVPNNLKKHNKIYYVQSKPGSAEAKILVEEGNK